ncbi:MAG: zf-HC2 domain-containing protein [Acidobacteriota bacterium]
MSGNDQNVFRDLVKRSLRNRSSLTLEGSCPDENQVTAYLEGILAPAARQKLEHHLAACSRCQEELSLVLKSSASDSVVLGQTKPAVSFSGWRNILGRWEWWHLKPALALLLVGVVSGVIGYKVLEQRRDQREEFAAMLDAASPAEGEVRSVESEKSELPSKTPMTSGGQLSPQRAPGSGPPLQGTGRFKEPLHRESRQTKEDDSGTANTTSTLEPKPASPPVAAEPAATGALVSSALNESADNKRMNVPLSREEASSGPVTETETAKAKGADFRADADSAKQELRGRDHVATDEIAVIDKAGPTSNREPVSDFKDDQAQGVRRRLSLSKSAGVAGESKAQRQTAPRQMTVAGKVFEQRDGVWTDTSINPREKVVVVVVRRDAPDFNDRVRPLAAYRAVLNMGEECLIRHQGKIYRIQ